ncbi:MAG: RNA methyltransferase [Actinomycetota bacterium]|nr:RNA methyltransferase [Actinomycetota bacterium]
MAIFEVDDVLDPRLADYVSLTDVTLRSRHEPDMGIYIAESAYIIRRALEAGHRPRSILMDRRWLDEMADVLESVPGETEVLVGEPALLEAVTGFHVHRGALAAMHRPALPTVLEIAHQAHRIVILEDLVNHTNVGAIFRSAAALGIDAVLVTPRCADPLYRRSVRVSMGTVFQIPWTRIADWPTGLDHLRGIGFTIAAISPLGKNNVDLRQFAIDLPERLALVFGTEGAGLTNQVAAEADLSVSIPMQGGVDSLNVAAASAVVFWALTKPENQPRL